MDSLCHVHIGDIGFLVGDFVSQISVGRYQIALHLESLWLITVYSEIHYTDAGGRLWFVQAEGAKTQCQFTEVLEKRITEVRFDDPDFLTLGYADNTTLKIHGTADGYEAFLLNGPDGQLYVFS